MRKLSEGWGGGGGGGGGGEKEDKGLSREGGEEEEGGGGTGCVCVCVGGGGGETEGNGKRVLNIECLREVGGGRSSRVSADTGRGLPLHATLAPNQTISKVGHASSTKEEKTKEK